MAKRKYTKRSDYWNKFNKDQPLQAAASFGMGDEDWSPELNGDSFYKHEARASSATSTVRRSNSIHRNVKLNKFTNINNGLLPYETSVDGINVRDTIELCQKAYANVPIFRNAIDIMSELANSSIYLEGGNTKSKDFINKWFEKIKLWNLKDQYFREYYRSGNIFLYRIDGKFSTEDFKKLIQVYGSGSLSPGKIPVKYIMLNPYDITIESSSSFDKGVYKKILSAYDLERLRSPKTDYDKEVFRSLDPELRKKLTTNNWSNDGAYITLDVSKLIYSFYKKQDYEPFAIPFGYPVLDDINWKMELKKIDQAISRTIQNVILLITMGNDPEKGGVSASNLSAMQSLFQNESVGRVLVSDYTTKADFVIPDLRKVIGPDKYQIVNEDIREGLQNIIVGNEKFANTQVKAQIFLERLKEARNAFLNDFLQPQIKMVCHNMGFRKYPIAKFEDIELKDEVQFQRVVTRLIELGILPPEEGIKAIKTGVYPEASSLDDAQEKYVEQRKKGYFNPIVGGVPMFEDDEEGEPKVSGPSAEVGRPAGTTGVPQEATDLYSRENVQSIVYKIEEFNKESLSSAKKIFKKKRLSKQQKDMVSQLTESVILASEQEDWKSTFENCLNDLSNIEKLDTKPEIYEMSEKHNLESYPAAILYHSSKERES